jgi:hypothetical protein
VATSFSVNQREFLISRGSHKKANTAMPMVIDPLMMKRYFQHCTEVSEVDEIF